MDQHQLDPGGNSKQVYEAQSDTSQFFKQLDFSQPDEQHNQLFVADIASRLSDKMLSQRGQALYAANIDDTLKTAKVERTLLAEVLFELSYEHDDEHAVETLFDMIGYYQQDPVKFKTFFDNTHAHFIKRNQLLFYDKSKCLEIGDKLDRYTEAYVCELSTGKQLSLTEVLAQRLIAESANFESLGIAVILIYISEAHVDDLWPINTNFKLCGYETNCNWYSSSNSERRLQRASKLVEVTHCPYPVYADTAADSYNHTLQVWPDQYNLVNTKTREILYKSQYSHRERGKIEIDCLWMLDFLLYARRQEKTQLEAGESQAPASMEYLVQRMMKSYYTFINSQSDSFVVQEKDMESKK